MQDEKFNGIVKLQKRYGNCGTKKPNIIPANDVLNTTIKTANKAIKTFAK